MNPSLPQAHATGLATVNAKTAEAAFADWVRGWLARGGATAEPIVNARAAWKAGILWAYGAGIDPRAEWIRLEDIETLFGMSRTVAARHLAQGHFSGFRDGKSVHIQLASVRQWFETQAAEVPSCPDSGQTEERKAA